MKRAQDLSEKARKVPEVDQITTTISTLETMCDGVQFEIGYHETKNSLIINTYFYRRNLFLNNVKNRFK